MKKIVGIITISMFLMMPFLLAVPTPVIAEPTEALSDAVSGGTGGTFWLDPNTLYTGGVMITGDTTIYGQGAMIDLQESTIDISGAYLYIERCHITNGTDGLYFHDDASGFVYDNVIVGNDEDGIYVEDCDKYEIVIKENSIIQNDDEGICFDDSTKLTMLENTIANNGDQGIDGDNGGLYDEDPNLLQDIKIKGNKISANDERGIYLDNVTGLSIASNLICANSNDAMELDYCPIVSVTHNKILANEYDGIEYDGDYNWPDYRDHTVELSMTISYNKILGNDGDGIELDYAKNIVITYNEIMWNEEDGMEIDGYYDYGDDSEYGTDDDIIFSVENILLAYNTISGNEDDGIDIDEVTELDILFNKITGNYYNGMDIDGLSYWENGDEPTILAEDLLIKGNVVIGNFDESIEVEDFNSPVIIEWNTVLGHEYEMELDWLESPQILHNTIMYNYDEGMEIDHCDGARIAYNTIAYNSDYANIDIGNCDDAIIEYNTLICSEEEGIEADYCYDMTIQYNKIYDNQEEGIDWYQCSGLIANNIIGYSGSLSGNEDGIYLDACWGYGPITISDNTIIGNDRGIDCSNSSATIIGNYIANNIYGIYIWEGRDETPPPNCTIGGTLDNRNYIIRNYKDGIYINNDAPVPLINYNNIYENMGYGVFNYCQDTTDAENNFWGDISGPGDPAEFGVGPGIGDEVSTNIAYSPWLVSIIP